MLVLEALDGGIRHLLGIERGEFQAPSGDRKERTPPLNNMSQGVDFIRQRRRKNHRRRVCTEGSR